MSNLQFVAVGESILLTIISCATLAEFKQKGLALYC